MMSLKVKEEKVDLDHRDKLLKNKFNMLFFLSFAINKEL